MLTKQLIFISGRFCSGTSMLWNIFNQLPQYCAFYEPLHPNLLSHIKHVKPKDDHIGIDDYWQNYLNLNDLEKYYSHKFGQQNLYLEKHEQWQDLEHYIKFLIASSGDRIPVLQFNRMDLRLSWLKNTFPHVTIIHINRQSYPLWISSRKHLQSDDDKHNESHQDAYDLMQWSVDLAKHFPMLQSNNKRNSYFRHYFIWKLSHRVAQSHADVHLSLENDFLNTHNGIETLTKKFDWDDKDKKLAESFIQKPKSMQDEPLKANRFSTIEAAIDKIFSQLGLTKLFPSSPLSEIKIEHQKAWSKYVYQPNICIQELFDALQQQKDELTALSS